jgi:hypothetical protein
MAQTHSRKYNPIEQWKTRERRQGPKGYVLVKVPEHPKAFGGGWYYEHRLIAERMLGRILRSHETVHHLNEVKYDNRELNLFVCTRSEHDYAHSLTLAVA